MRLKINSKKIDKKIIDQAVTVLKTGGILIYPTDTIYGIGCDANNIQAVKKIKQLKGRNQQQPFSIICPNLTHISQLSLVTNYAYRVLKKYLPGPFTFILPATKLVPKLVQHPKTKTVGIRIPDHPICTALVNGFNGPIITTSINKHGQEALSNPDLIANDWLNKVDCFLDCGFIGNQSSTIISLIDDAPQIIRQGKGKFLEN